MQKRRHISNITSEHALNAALIVDPSYCYTQKTDYGFRIFGSAIYPEFQFVVDLEYLGRQYTDDPVPRFGLVNQMTPKIAAVVGYLAQFYYFGRPGVGNDLQKG